MEYLRAYRGLQLLAVSLAGHGFHTLRFDYRGTGDSFGDARNVTLTDWTADTRLAAQHLLASTGASRLAIIGLRFGALLAQQAVADGVKADALALWDAPPSGEVYVENLRHLDRTIDEDHNRFRAPRAQLPAAAPDELLGHAWPAKLESAVTALPGLRSDLSIPLHILVSRDRTPAEGVESLRLPNAGHWSDGSRLSSPWLPEASVKAITEHFETVLA
jgi:pimeloyl-ACP methyl ester carboxylesterase